ncbi:MAG: hypothetical protein KG075_16070 [Alphaproteobacteria bacterium]|nr:hypothetical protein [Alphaproteobacteria bacterium]
MRRPLADYIASAVADHGSGAAAHIELRNILLHDALIALYCVLSDPALAREFTTLAKERGVGVRKDTPLATALTKLIFGTNDKDMSQRYGLVLRACCVLGISPDELIDHLRDRGSVNELLSRYREAIGLQAPPPRLKPPRINWTESAIAMLSNDDGVGGWLTIKVVRGPRGVHEIVYEHPISEEEIRRGAEFNEIFRKLAQLKAAL